MRRRAHGPCKGGCGGYAFRMSASEALAVLRRAQADASSATGTSRGMGRVDHVAQSLAGLCDACEKRARRCAIVRELPIPALPATSATCEAA